MLSSALFEGVPANYDKFKNGWGSYKSKLESILGRSDDRILSQIRTLMDLEEDADVEDIVNHEKGPILYTVYRFVKGKEELVEDFARKRSGPIDSPFLYVLERIGEEDSDIIYKLLLYSLWNKSKGERRYAVQDELPDDYIERFDESARGLRMMLSQRTRNRKYLYDERNRIEFSNSTIFVLDRQTSDREKRDVQGTIRRRPLNSIFIEIHEEDKEVRIRTNSTKIRETVLEKIQNEFAISLKPADIVDEESAIDTDAFREKISEEEAVVDEEDIRITNVEFRKTNIPPSVPVTFSKKSRGVDIRGVLESVSGEDALVNGEIQNIRKFWFSVYETDARVKVKINDRGGIRLESKINTQDSEKRQKVADKFFDEFNIPLDQDIPPHLVSETRESIITFLLNDPPRHEIRSAYSEIMEDLEDLGVINIEEIKKKKCRDCEAFYTGYDECQRCGGALTEVTTEKDINTNERGVRSFFKSLLEREDIEYIGQRRERIYQTEYTFMEVRKDGTAVHIWLNTDGSNIPEKSILHLQKSINPVLIVNPTRSQNEALIERTHSDYINISEAIDKHLDGDLPESFVSDKLHTITRYIEDKTAQKARHSYEELQEIINSAEDASPQQFEKEVFHIINQIVPFADQWGTKRSGKKIPDGFADLTFKRGQHRWSRSFGWDTKFKHDPSEFTIESKEVENIRSYIHKIKDSEEVTKSDTEFKHFLVITNAQEPDNFGTKVAGPIHRMRSWDGVPVLAHIDFFVGLHILYNDNLEEIKRHRDTFNELLYKTLNGGSVQIRERDEDEYVFLDDASIEELYEEFQEEIPNDEDINIDGLREFMEQDIFP